MLLVDYDLPSIGKPSGFMKKLTCQKPKPQSNRSKEEQSSRVPAELLCLPQDPTPAAGAGRPLGSP